MLLCRPVILDPADPTRNVVGSNPEGWWRLAGEATVWLQYPCIKNWDTSRVRSWDVPVRICHHSVSLTTTLVNSSIGRIFKQKKCCLSKGVQACRLSCHTACFTVILGFRDCHITPAEFLLLSILRNSSFCSECLLCVQALSCILYHTVSHWIHTPTCLVFFIIQ